jgi:hypothetical protein
MYLENKKQCSGDRKTSLQSEAVSDFNYLVRGKGGFTILSAV